jgi:APA family basic amino acid/polyamine antiporter
VQHTATSAGSGLARDLGRWDLVALVVNSVIGAGIFGLPSRVYATAGAYSLVAYLAAGLAIGLIVTCFAEVSSRFRDTGGPYLYARVAFGSFAGFEIGWLMWLARIAALAALGNLGVGYVTYFLPALGDETWRAVLLAVAIVALTLVNVMGVRVTATVTNLFTVAKLVPLVLIVAAGLFLVRPDAFAFDNVPDYRAFSQASLLLVFAFTGFEGAVIPAGEMRDPNRHLPFALITSIGLVAALYVLVQAVSIGTVPDLAAAERPLAEVGLRALGPIGASLVAAGAIVSITGTMNALMFATPRLLFAMAERRQLPRLFAVTHERWQSPVAAVVLTAAVTLVFSLSSTFLSALTISAIIRLFAYATTAAALPVLRRKPEAPPAAFRAPAGTLVSVAAVLLSAWLLSNSTVREARLALGAAAVGAIVYLVGQRAKGRGQKKREHA